MATKKISELDALSEADDNDVLVIVDVSSQTTYKISKQNFLSDIKAQIEELEENQLKNLLLGKENGQELTLTECSNKTFKDIKVKGYSERNGIPTSENPISINDSGSLGVIRETISNEEETETQTFSIPCQQPMRSIGEIRDEFIKIEGTWYERHNIGSILLNGTEDGWRDDIHPRHYFYNRTIIKSIVKGAESTHVAANILSDRFPTTTYYEMVDATEDGIAINNSGYLGISCYPERYESLSHFETWLSNNNVNLIFELAEPTDLVCTQQQVTALEQIIAAHTYKGVTTISSQDTVPAYIEAIYLKDLELVIDDLIP